MEVSVGDQIKFKSPMRRSSLQDYSDLYITVKGTITITGAGAYTEIRQANKRKSKYYIKIVCHLLIA